jgi:hypothetical protein
MCRTEDLDLFLNVMEFIKSEKESIFKSIKETQDFYNELLNLKI